MQPLRLSLIINTSERPAALDLVLQGVQRQTRTADEIWIADDGSGESTRALIQSWQGRLGGNLGHVWHEKKGFRRSVILNKTLARTTGDYIVFLDGDCVPHRRFIADHARLAEPGYWVQGRRCFVKEQWVERFRPGRTPVWIWIAAGRISGGAKAVRYPRAAVRRDTRLEGILGCNLGFWRQDLIRAIA
ncbi:MAG: glycosyltransferase, partial [Candidatus Omnitrophica bacterium]|nr:glycosyltransferase [Candidatus Omnitrophota bacterium]